jgi:hypothetical protein
MCASWYAECAMPDPMTRLEQIRFVAPDGSHWTVHEISGSVERPWAARSLIFVGDQGFRRVYSYPENWRELSAEQLFALSWMK